MAIHEGRVHNMGRSGWDRLLDFVEVCIARIGEEFGWAEQVEGSKQCPLRKGN